MHSDSKSAIHLAKNIVFHSRTKIIGIRYQFIRSLLEDEVLTLKKIVGSKNPRNMLMKGGPTILPFIISYLLIFIYHVLLGPTGRASSAPFLFVFVSAGVAQPSTASSHITVASTAAVEAAPEPNPFSASLSGRYSLVVL
ncbi:Unknown protein [Striga hermonthica]|uniref:Uncharacterized protein n=1 Tax=Striga hermonthica TaxID=68872 RepID=A0A9N7MR01_STRHE|nr:Unknown protein [Striga hermonthica]